MLKLAITVVSIAFLSASGVAQADAHAGLQEQVAKLKEGNVFLRNRLDRAISYSRENRKALEDELAMHKQKSVTERQTLLHRIDRARRYSKERIAGLEEQLAMHKASSAKERQTLLRRIDRAKTYSRANRAELSDEMAAQKQKSAKERQTLLRRIDRTKAYSRERISNLENELATQKASSTKERQTLLRRIDRAKAYSRARIEKLQNSQSDWAVSVGATLDNALGGIQGTTVSTNSDDSVTIQVGNNGLFRTGSTALSDDGAQLLTTVAQELANTDGNITVTGHTDNVPVGSGSRFSSNDELSFARATSTLSFLRGQGISTARLFAAGYGADRPIATNDTIEGRQQNRRVEIIVSK